MLEKLKDHPRGTRFRFRIIEKNKAALAREGEGARTTGLSQPDSSPRTNVLSATETRRGVALPCLGFFIMKTHEFVEKETSCPTPRRNTR